MSVKKFQDEGINFKGDTKANLDSLDRDKGNFLHATDESKLYYDDGTDLKEIAFANGGGSGPSTEALHYATFTGSAGASVAVTNQSQASTFTVSQVSAGVFDIDYSSLSLSQKPCIVPMEIVNGSTSNEVGCYLVSASSTVARIRTHVNRSPSDLDFNLMLCPQGGDAPSQTGQTVYAGITNVVGSSIVSQNVGSSISVSKITFPTSGYLVYRFDYTGLSLTVTPAVFANFLDGGSASDDKKIIGAQQGTTESQIQVNDFDGGDPNNEREIHFIMFLSGADDTETVVANSKWFVACSEKASSIARENISSFYDSATFSTPTYTWDYTSGSLTNTPCTIAFGWNPFNGGDGSSRHFSNQSFGTAAAVNSMSSASNNSASNSFTNMNIIVLPTGSDSRY